jgi:hypothetical protein
MDVELPRRERARNEPLSVTVPGYGCEAVRCEPGPGLRSSTTAAARVRAGRRHLAATGSVTLADALGVRPVLVIRLAVLHKEFSRFALVNHQEE